MYRFVQLCSTQLLNQLVAQQQISYSVSGAPMPAPLFSVCVLDAVCLRCALIFTRFRHCKCNFDAFLDFKKPPLNVYWLLDFAQNGRFTKDFAPNKVSSRFRGAGATLQRAEFENEPGILAFFTAS